MIKTSTVKMFRCEFETLIPKWGEGSSSSLLQIWIFCVLYLENYSSCVVYVPSYAVCISTLASSAVPPSNQHTAASTLAGQVITYIVIKSHVVNQNSNLSSD